MKKVLALVMALVLVLSLAACGGLGKTIKQTVSLGKTVSTDIVDFTLEKAKLSYYASASSTNYAEPINKSDGGIFSAAKGRVYVCMTFTIKNKDRDHLDVGDSFSNWKMMFTVSYKGKDYPVNGFDLNDKDGREGLNFSDSVVSYNGGKTFNKNGTLNLIVEEGRTATVRVLGVAKFDPENLNDPFKLTVNIPNSNDKNDYYTYEVI